jgi:hypothetical protein
MNAMICQSTKAAEREVSNISTAKSSVEVGLFWAFQALALPLPAAAGLILLMRLRDVVILLAGAAALPGLRSPLAAASES